MKSDRLTIIVSVLGVILTAASVVASVAQYRAADLQAQAAVVTLMPQIEVRALLEKIDSDKFTDSRVEISSDGGPIYNLQVDRMSWVEIRDGSKVAFEQPLHGYYFAEYPTSRTRGLVRTIKGHRNNEVFGKFLDWSSKVLPIGGTVSLPQTLLKLSYVDALHREGVAYVQLNGGSELHLSAGQGADAWKAHAQRAKEVRSLDIDNLENPGKAGASIALWTRAIQDAHHER